MIRTACRLAVAVAALAAAAASAQDDLSMLCSAPLAWCEVAAAAFLRETGIPVKLAQKAASEALAQIAAEKSDPKHDLWFGGGSEFHLQAAELGLSDEHRSPRLPELHDWAVRAAERSRWRTVGLYAGIPGIGYNANVLAKKKLPEPKCWADLAKPEYRGQIQMPNPGAPAALPTIATLVEVFGEDKAFELLAAIHRNVSDYPRTTGGAIRAAARGEAAIAVTFLHDGAVEIANGFPIRLVVPCEGTGADVAALSLVRGARNPRDARRFYDWALTPAAQKLGGDTRNYQMPSNKATPVAADAPDVNDGDLIKPDEPRLASAAERARLLERWERDVRALPRR